MDSTALMHRTVSKGFPCAFLAALLLIDVAPALAAPNLQFTKSAADSTISAGDTATFNFTVKNKGSSDADFPQLLDPLPGGGGIDWTTSTPACFVDGFPPLQTLECDFD